MSWWPELEKFLFGFLGAILGGSFIAWITGYYSEKGKRDLLREEWPKLLEEARQRSYEEEAGKRLATKADIENVLEHVRLVTAETEAIKAEISQGLWHRQWLIEQKKEIYGSLLEALDVIYDLCEAQDRVYKQALNAFEASQAFEALNEKSTKARRTFQSLVTQALIFLKTDATSALETYVDLDLSLLGFHEGKRQAAIGDCKHALIKAAKDEFGIRSV